MAREEKEARDLLAVYNKERTELKFVTEKNSNEPPDGGVWAYSVVMGSFLTNGILFGMINSYGPVNNELVKQLQQDNVLNAKERASLVGSLAFGITFLLSPVSGILTELLGFRPAAVLGGSIAALGLFMSSFVATRHIDVLCFTYGITYGLGASLAYTPSLAVLGHYFKKYLGLVNGIVTIGSCIFTVIITPLIGLLIDNYGIEWMFRVFAAITLGVALCGLLFKPTPFVNLEKPLREDKSLKSMFKYVVNVEIWQNPTYRIWALSMPVALFGYYVPYVNLNKFVETKFAGVNRDLPVQCLAITSGIGRLLFGYLADKPWVNRIMVQQVSFYVMGLMNIILPQVQSFALVVAIALGMGLCDGAFISLIGPIAFELCGESGAAQAIGCMLGLAAVPISVGAPIAALLLETSGSYTLPFTLAGVSPLVGATLMFLTRWGNKDRTNNKINGHAQCKENGTLDAERCSDADLNDEQNEL